MIEKHRAYILNNLIQCQIRNKHIYILAINIRYKPCLQYNLYMIDITNYDEMQLLLLEGIEHVIKENKTCNNNKYQMSFATRLLFNILFKMTKYDVIWFMSRVFITVTWPCVLKLPVTILFAQQLIVLNYKETIQSLTFLWGESISD